MFFFDAFQKVKAAHPGQPDVGNYEVRVFGFDERKRLLGRGAGDGLVSFGLQELLEGEAHAFFVVNDKDSTHSLSPPPR